MPCYYDVLTKKGASYEHGQNYFFSSNGILASIQIPQMRPTLSGRLQDSKLFVHGSILCMAFAQLTYRENLRDIESCLRFMQPKLYHMGFRTSISKST